MLRIRDDDVLVSSSSWGRPFERFRELHDWIAKTEGKVVHVPTVLVRDVQRFPDCVEYMKEHTASGTMEPEVHGFTHIDYSRLGLDPTRLPPRGRVDHSKFTQEELDAHANEVFYHLWESRTWIYENLGRMPLKWYTPWGADNGYLRAAAEHASLKLVGTEKLFDIAEACDMLRNGASLEDVEKRGEIFMHWWHRGTRVKRLCAAVRHGSWAEAEKQEPATFKE